MVIFVYLKQDGRWYRPIWCSIINCLHSDTFHLTAMRCFLPERNFFTKSITLASTRICCSSLSRTLVCISALNFLTLKKDAAFLALAPVWQLTSYKNSNMLGKQDFPPLNPCCCLDKKLNCSTNSTNLFLINALSSLQGKYIFLCASEIQWCISTSFLINMHEIICFPNLWYFPFF